MHHVQIWAITTRIILKAVFALNVYALYRGQGLKAQTQDRDEEEVPGVSFAMDESTPGKVKKYSTVLYYSLQLIFVVHQLTHETMDDVTVFLDKPELKLDQSFFYGVQLM